MCTSVRIKEDAKEIDISEYNDKVNLKNAFSMYKCNFVRIF